MTKTTLRTRQEIPNDDNLDRAEWQQWRDICTTLLAFNVVTKVDLEAPVYADKTGGQKLLSDIRFWGGLRAKQGQRVIR